MRPTTEVGSDLAESVVLERFTPDQRERWWRVIEGAGAPGLGLAPDWLEVIQRAYRHEPLYLWEQDAEGRAAVLPAFVVRRPLSGTVVTSMPFLDAAGPSGGSEPLVRRLVTRLMAEAHRRGASRVELRCTRPAPGLPVEPRTDKVNLVRALPSAPDRLWAEVGGKVRNQVRKAEQAGLSVIVGGDGALPAFYDCFAINMRDLGSPVHSLAFFRAVLAELGSRARVALVRKGETVIGGLVAIAFRERLCVPWASCRREYFAWCPNMLLYWETLAAACREGFRAFEFGRSSRGSGTYQFKRQWGALEEPLYWYTMTVGRRSPGPLGDGHGGRGGALLVKLWQRLPVGVSRRLGPPIRRYLTQ